MLEAHWPSEKSDSKAIAVSYLAALFIEILILAVVGYRDHWLAHPKTGMDESRFIEAQVFEVPPEAHLVEQKPIHKVSRPEPVLSKRPLQGHVKKPSDAKPIQEENQTSSGEQMAANHGPVPVYAPQPVLPDYLRDQDIQTSVVIDFYVTAQGVATPRLVGSSGNDELDALAITTAKKWQFRPGEQNHKPVDSKVRLRIIFEVH